jgi:D-glycerate 3-kinase
MNFTYNTKEQLIDNLNELSPNPLITLLTKAYPSYDTRMIKNYGKIWKVLKSDLLRREEQRNVYGVNRRNVDKVLYERLRALADVWKEFEDLRINKLKIPDDLTLRLWYYYIPDTEWIIKKREKVPEDKAYILGINGGQGSGKSTLVSVLKLLLKKRGLDAVAVSIDDYYLTYEEREVLKKRIPLYWARGPAGTHDVKLGIDTFTKMKNREPTEIPVFDKGLKGGAGDRLPKEKWQKVEKTDIVLFEGCWVGCRPLSEEDLNKPTGDELVDSIERKNDPNGTFRRIINEELKKYGPWFDLLDNLWALKVKLKQAWDGRKLQERKMREERGIGMTDEQVDKFMDYWAHFYRFFYAVAESKDTDITFKIGENFEIEEVIGKKQF